MSQAEAKISRDEDAPAPLPRWRRVTQSRAFGWARDLSVLALIFLAITAYQTRGHVARDVDAPAFTLGRLGSDAMVSTASLHGKKTVLLFWAPWCGVCGAESDNIKALHRRLGDDVNVISIALAYESIEDVEDFARRHEIDYPVLLGSQRQADDYNVTSFPTAYILDEQGRVAHTVVGYTTQLGLHLRLWMT